MASLFHPRAWFRSASITTKLTLVLVLTAILPMAVISGYHLYVHTQDLVQRSLDSLERLAVSQAEIIQRLVVDTQSTLNVLASDPEVVAYLEGLPDPPADVAQSARQAFVNTLAANPFYEYVYLMDPQGMVVISVQLPDLKSIEGKNFADRTYFLSGLAGREHIDVLVGRVSKKMGFYFSRPVFNAEGQVVGVAVIKLRGTAITDVIAGLNQDSEDISAMLIDQDGVIVTPPRGHPDWVFHSVVPISPPQAAVVRQRFVLNSVPALSLSTLSSLVHVEESGSLAVLRDDQPENKMVLGYAPIRPLQWTVVVSIPPQRLASKVIASVRVTALTSLIFMAVAALIAGLVARGIVRPLQTLGEAAQRIERDEPFEPEDIAEVMDRQDEIGHLARTFSAMVVALRARIAELRTIFQISQKISAGVGLDQTLQYVLSALHEVIPYDVAELSFFDAQNRKMQVRARANYLQPDPQPIVYYEAEIAPTYLIDEAALERLSSRTSALLLEQMEPDSDLDAAGLERWGPQRAQAYLGIVLKAGGRVLGALELVGMRSGQFTEDNRRLLSIIAPQIAMEIKNAQEIQERERRLAHQIQHMEIVIDRNKMAQQVELIVRSETFRRLQKQRQQWRKKKTTS